MASDRAKRIAWLLVIGTFVSVATALAYRAILAPWRGDVREPLIAALLVGVTFWMICLIGLRQADRREQAARQDQEN